MHRIKNAIVIIGLAAIATSALAQEKDAPTSFTYATYFYCDAGGQDRADELIKKDAAVYDQMVKDGVITAWGWLAHHTGGKWRRILYYQAPTVAGLLDAQDDMDKRFSAMGGDDNEFGSICRLHDDYIWERESGSSGTGRGPAGFSVYYHCDEAREDRADEIVAKDFAPILNKYVAEGKFTSWGWQSHWVGGEYRRLQTMTAADFKSLLKARGELIDEMYAEGSKAGEEFTSICGSHADYMWNIELETP